MSDGEINLALLQYKSEEGSGVPKGWTGIHHFGFQCDDLPAQQKQIEKAGGKFFFDLGDPDDDGFERKFKDPNGIVFDINWKGWQLTKAKVKNAKGGLVPATKRAAAARKKVSKKTAKPGQGGAQEEISSASADRGRNGNDPAGAFACACCTVGALGARRRTIRRGRSP